MWQSLSLEEATAWRRFALGSAVRNPQTGGLKVPSAYALFSGYGSKYLMVHGGFEVPRLPPTGRFMGDALRVVVAPGSRSPSGSSWREGRGERPAEPPSPAPSSITSQMEEGVLRFTADATNREGVLTELLAQRVPCAHALPKAKSYLSLGFATMEVGVPVVFPVGLGGRTAAR